MALEGHHLTVAIGYWMPWCEISRHANGSLIVSGVAIEVFELIASKLNFTYTFVHEPSDEWGRKLTNDTWTGMIGMLDRKEVDMAVGPFSVTYERSSAVDFSLDLHVDQYGIFLPRPLMEEDLMAFLKPFPWQMWLALIIVMIISMIAGMLMDYLLVKFSGSKVVTFRPVWIIRALVNEPAETAPTSDTGRIFTATWLIVALIIDTAYSGVLTSLLTIPIVTVPVDSLDDLVAQDKIPWAVERGSAMQQLFMSAKGDIYKKIYDGAKLVKSAFDERDRIKSLRMAVVCDQFSMKKVMNDDFAETGKCNYYIARKPIKSSSMAYAFQKGSWITPHFDRWMGPLKESGVISKKINSLTSNATACMVAPGKEMGTVVEPLSMTNMTGIFLLVLTGMLIGLFLLMAERLVYFSKASKHKQGKNRPSNASAPRATRPR
ncbi:probable glutamate receptor [Palaemon carinicauda]|uniref:probable glutamate receptor n=1 Tax=Palaemon carinicauda TaxID=392227 RepID=UPI0035B57ED3